MEDLRALGSDLTVSDVEILRRVATLDTQFGCDPYYSQNINGFLGNIGADRQSIVLLANAIGRLQGLISKPHGPAARNKLTYDLATLIHSKADIMYPFPRTVKTLIGSSEFVEAARIYRTVQDTPPHSMFPLATTNAANILDQFGRNYEAIFLYDRAIERYPRFGMALGNKAKALLYYSRLCTQVPMDVICLAKNLFTQALADPELEEIGGDRVVHFFRAQVAALGSQSVSADSGLSEMSLTGYQAFSKQRNLFLNLHFGFVISEASVIDDMFPPFLQKTSDPTGEGAMSAKIHLSIRVYNQILEEFAASRFQLFQALNESLESVDLNTKYIYTFEYARNGVRNGLLKGIYARLFNTLDKIALIVFVYFELLSVDSIPTDFSYDWLTKPEFAELIVHSGNFQLLALHGLAKDFKEGGAYFRLRERRNLITHRFLDVHEIPPQAPDNYHLSTQEILDDLQNLFLMSKASLFYLYAAVDIDTRLRKDEDAIGTMHARLQSEIFKE